MNISQKFVDRVEELKHHTKTSIDDIQMQCCPMVKDIYLHHQFEYWYEGYKYNIWEHDVHLYAVKEIPYCYDNNLKNVSFQGKLEDLVNEDKVWPFLLFVNGYVVPWSKITIIRDYDYSYLRIDGEKDDYSESCKMLYFPLGSKKIRYGEDEDFSRDPEINGLYFDRNGAFLRSPEFQELSVRFEFKSDIFFRIVDLSEYYDNSETDSYVLVPFTGLEFGKVPTLKNMLMFDGSGKFEDSAEKNPEKINDSLNGAYGNFMVSNSYTNSGATMIQMYFNNHTTSKSYIYTKEDLSQDKILDLAYDKTYFPPIPSEIKNMILSPFDFKFQRDNSYEKNIRNSMRTITQYDYALWNNVFINESPVKSFTYTGREFKKLSDLRSYVRFSRKHSDLIEDVVMMFVNSQLYEHSIDISYTNNTINIPAFGILDDDVVELVMFTKCNNNILNIVIPNGTTPVYIHPEYSLDDCYIMDDQTLLTKYPDVPDSNQGRKQYICKILTSEKGNNNTYTIQFEDPSHYNRKLKIVPKNQFRYYRFRQLDAGQHKIILPQQFNYCHDVDRYMIFVNGQKIDKTEYTITIMNEYRPFDQLILYLTTILDIHDRVDIFYVPEYLVEKYKEPRTTWNGIVRLSTNYPKLYALSKYTCMVFVNGLKINPLDIDDISMNTITVNTRYQTVSNVTIIEYLNGSKEISKYLFGTLGVQQIAGDVNIDPNYEELKDICGQLLSDEDSFQIGIENDDTSRYLYDQWQYIMDSLVIYFEQDRQGDYIERMIDCIYQLFPALDPMNVMPNYKNDYDTLKSILYDIVVDYYIQRNGVNTGDVFDYDFEIDQWSRDNMDNMDITLYPDHDKLLDYLLNVQDVSDKDVMDGKKYLD